MNDEASYNCDSCGEEIVVPIDLTAGARQEYVEIALFAAARTSFMSRLMTRENCGCGRRRSRLLPLYQDDWFALPTAG
jgi:Cysteine-rich CPXCG